MIWSNRSLYLFGFTDPFEGIVPKKLRMPLALWLRSFSTKESHSQFPPALCRLKQSWFGISSSFLRPPWLRDQWRSANQGILSISSYFWKIFWFRWRPLSSKAFIRFPRCWYIMIIPRLGILIIRLSSCETEVNPTAFLGKPSITTETFPALPIFQSVGIRTH